MLCERCNQKNATLYVSKYKDGQIKKRYLCNDCAKEKGNVSSIIQPAFEDFLIGILEMALEPRLVVCEHCKMTIDEFIKNGRFECSNCYEAFEELLENTLKKIQPSKSHVGKVPKSLASLVKVKKDIEDLKKKWQEDLKLAIQDERYEDAATLRDQIRSLDKEGNEDE